MSKLDNFWSPLPDRGSPEHVEALIKAAGSYVVPSDGLRGKVLDEARDIDRRRRTNRRVFGGTAALVACCVGGLLFVCGGGRDNSASIRWSSDVNQGALELVRTRNMSYDWAILESFTSVRLEQAKKFPKPQP